MSKNLVENNLFKCKGLPDFKKFTPEKITAEFPILLEEIEKEFKDFETSLKDCSKTQELRWEMIMTPISNVNEKLRWSWGVINHLNSVNNSESLRTVYSNFLPSVISLGNKFGQSKLIYLALKELRKRGQLDQIKNRILDKEILDMEHSGISLGRRDQEEFNNISERLGELSTKFSNNILDSTNKWFLILEESSQTEGLPERVKELMALAAKKHLNLTGDCNPTKGPWKLGLDAPTYSAFMTYSENRSLREELYKAFVSRASNGHIDNNPIIEEILSLRLKQANLIGYKNWAELSLSTKMAGQIKNVEKLLEELRGPAFSTAEFELSKLKSFARKNGFYVDDEIQPWDINYWAEKFKQKTLNLDQEALRPWFPLNDVLEGLFKLSEKLFDIKVVEATGEAPTWHDDVMFFNILNSNKKKIASFYLDPYSRPETKRGGAWMDECLNKNKAKNGEESIPVAYLVCNQTPASNKKPSLMSFDEVQTLFHEFGHGLQHMLTTIDLPQAAGINNVEWDAVELPSQFMENWCYDKTTLLNIAKHWETGEGLPIEDYEKLCASRTFNCGISTLRQLHFAITDLRLHSNLSIHEGKSSDQIRRDISKDTSVIEPIREDKFLCSFSHIFAGGYSAGYYSYKWAEVLSADAFSMFEEAGLDNHEEIKDIGKKFKNTILSLGGSLSPLEIFILFRGREPKTDSLIRQLGLST